VGRGARAGGAAALGVLALGAAPAAAVPVIARTGPAPVAPGDLLTVLGSGFGPAPGILTIGGVPAPVLTWADGAVRAWVPELPPGITALAVQAADGVTAPLPIGIAPPPPLPPVAIPMLTGPGGPALRMDARLSLDPDDRAARLGAGLYALWSFGDGEEAAGAVVHHAYRRAGRYTVRLHVWDASGLQGTGVARVRVAPVGAVRVGLGSPPQRPAAPRRRRAAVRVAVPADVLFGPGESAPRLRSARLVHRIARLADVVAVAVAADREGPPDVLAALSAARAGNLAAAFPGPPRAVALGIAPLGGPPGPERRRRTRRVILTLAPRR
jgi:PKD domain-containing protein